MSDRKLTLEDANEIREWRDKYLYTQSELAAIFGVSRTTVRRVLAGESYFSEEDGDDITPMAGVDDDRPLAPSNVPKVIDNDSYNASYGIVLWTVLGACVWGAAYLIWRAFM